MPVCQVSCHLLLSTLLSTLHEDGSQKAFSSELCLICNCVCRSKFKCAALKLAMIKNQHLAESLFEGNVYDCVCLYEPAAALVTRTYT